MGTGNDTDGVGNPLIKFLMFFFNFLFWLIGGAFIGIGLWAYIEKKTVDYGIPEDDELDFFDLVFDVTIVMISLGVVIFIVAFAGCIGALRENICLLKFFSYFLGVIFLIELILAILAFVFSSEVKAKVIHVLQTEGIVRYRDDPDLMNIIDWIQKTFSCCGMGIKGFKDWSLNPYFNCTRDNPSPEACAVPFSCCKVQDDIEDSIINTMCGYYIQELSYPEAVKKVHITGCVSAVLSFAEENLYIIGGVALGMAIPQLLGMLFGCFLIREIRDARRAYW